MRLERLWNAYLQIELARFTGHLGSKWICPKACRTPGLPTFSLQPIVENAIKHGTSQLLCEGQIRIDAKRHKPRFVDTRRGQCGALRRAAPKGDGLGMTLVDRRDQNRYGEAYGVEVTCERESFTRVTLRVPLEILPA